MFLSLRREGCTVLVFFIHVCFSVLARWIKSAWWEHISHLQNLQNAFDTIRTAATFRGVCGHNFMPPLVRCPYALHIVHTLFLRPSSVLSFSHSYIFSMFSPLTGAHSYAVSSLWAFMSVCLGVRPVNLGQTTYHSSFALLWGARDNQGVSLGKKVKPK